MRGLIRVLPSLCVIAVAAASFALSYVALRDVSAQLEAVPAYLAFLVPVVVDGGIIAGSAVIWDTSRSARRRHWFPYFFVAVLVVMSVVMNVAHAGDATLAKVIAALPPLVLLGSIELVAAQGMRATAAAAAPTTPPAQVAPIDQAAPTSSPTTAGTSHTQPAQLPPSPPVQSAGQPAGAPEVPAERPASLAPVPAKPPAVPAEPAPAASASRQVPQPAQPDVAPAPVSAAVERPATAVQEPTAPAASERTGGAPSEGVAPAGPSRTAPRRALRTRAQEPDTAADAGPASDPAGDDVPAGERVRELFAAHLAAGGAAEDPQLANAIAAQLGKTPSYVRKLLRPLRDPAAA